MTGAGAGQNGLRVVISRALKSARDGGADDGTDRAFARLVPLQSPARLAVCTAGVSPAGAVARALSARLRPRRAARPRVTVGSTSPFVSYGTISPFVSYGTIDPFVSYGTTDPFVSH